MHKRYNLALKSHKERKTWMCNVYLWELSYELTHRVRWREQEWKDSNSRNFIRFKTTICWKRKRVSTMNPHSIIFLLVVQSEMKCVYACLRCLSYDALAKFSVYVSNAFIFFSTHTSCARHFIQLFGILLFLPNAYSELTLCSSFTIWCYYLTALCGVPKLPDDGISTAKGIFTSSMQSQLVSLLVFAAHRRSSSFIRHACISFFNLFI